MHFLKQSRVATLQHFKQNMLLRDAMFEIHCNQIVVMWLYGMTGTSKLKPEILA